MGQTFCFLECLDLSPQLAAILLALLGALPEQTEEEHECACNRSYNDDGTLFEAHELVCGGLGGDLGLLGLSL